jgi:hypothetical protein
MKMRQIGQVGWMGLLANGIATTGSLEQYQNDKDVAVNISVSGFLLKECGNDSEVFEYPDTGYAVNIEQDCYADSADLTGDVFHCQLKLDYDTLMRAKAKQIQECKRQ